MTASRTDGTARRDLVLAAAQDYEWEQVRVFVESLRATGFDGEVRFFAPGISDSTAKKLAEARVEISRPPRVRLKVGRTVWHPYNTRTTRLRWHVQPLYRHGVAALSVFSRDRRAARARVAAALANVDVARYFWAYLYLSANASRYRNVMLTDVRDVVFLRDPFAFDVDGAVHFFLEDEKTTLSGTVNNRGWLAGAYGPETLDELGGRSISCSGITIGAVPAVLEYLELMVDALARLPRQFHGIDQGVHNYVVHKGLVPRGRIAGNDAGPVLTLGIMSAEDATRILHARAEEVNVVHQYDRHPELAHELTSSSSA
jgi:hypothetical protein